MKFAILPESVLIDQRLTKNDLRVLLALLCHANKKGYCWPSRSALGVMLNVDDRKVSVITGRLCKYGYLSKIKNYVRPNGQCVTFAYQVKVTEPVTVTETVTEKVPKPVTVTETVTEKVPETVTVTKPVTVTETVTEKVPETVTPPVTETVTPSIYKKEPTKNQPRTNHHTGSTNADAEKKPAAPSKKPANGCGVSRDSMDQVLGIFNRQRLKRFALPPLEMSGAVKKPLQKILKMHPLEEVLLVAEDYCSWAAERYLHPRNCFALSKFEGKLQSALDQQNAKPLEPGLHRIRNREPDALDLYFQQREHHETTIIDHADFENFEIPTPASTANS